MKIWTVESKSEEWNEVELSDEFWESQYGRVTAERCHDLDQKLSLFLAYHTGAVLWDARGYQALRATVLHNWPKEK